MILHKKPIIMGVVMGAAMLAMMHQMLSGDSTLTMIGLIMFVGAHVGVLLVIAFAAVFAAHLSPRTKAWVARLHRPKLAHVALMLGSAAIVAGVAHLIIHSGAF